LSLQELKAASFQIQNSTRQSQRHDVVEVKQGQLKQEDSNPSQRRVPQVGTWGQAVVQDGGNVVHGIGHLPFILFMYK